MCFSPIPPSDLWDPTWEEDVRGALRGFTVELRTAGSEAIIACPPQFSVLARGRTGSDSGDGSGDGGDSGRRGACAVLGARGEVLQWPCVAPAGAVPVHATAAALDALVAEAEARRAALVSEREAQIAGGVKVPSPMFISFFLFSFLFPLFVKLFCTTCTNELDFPKKKKKCMM
jgi:hypothetical protein